MAAAGPTGPDDHAPSGPAPSSMPPSDAAPSGPAAPRPRPAGWTAGRIVALVIGSVLLLISLGLLGGGGAALWADSTQRQGGFVDLATTNYSTAGYAVASDTIELHATAGGWDVAKSLFGKVRIRATSASGTPNIFIGIAPADAASRYLAGVEYVTVRGTTDDHGVYTGHTGTAPGSPPTHVSIWTAQVTGPGTQTLVWPVKSGSWTVVAMNADGSRPVAVSVNLAATLPSLGWVAWSLLAAGVVFLAGGAILVAVAIRRAS